MTAPIPLAEDSTFAGEHHLPIACFEIWWKRRVPAIRRHERKSIFFHLCLPLRSSFLLWNRVMRFRFAFLLALLVASQTFGAGRQLTGVYTPTPTPALPPSEAQKKFTVPPGFEVRL